jgi:TatD DNase family protein
VIDSHAHVADASFDGDREAVLARAIEAGVRGIVCIGQDADTSRRALELQRRGFAGLRLAATAGLHPHEARRREAELPQIAELLSEGGAAAVGETGLDFHYNYSPPKDQRESFRWHLDRALACAKPAVVHVREAHREAIEDLSSRPGVRFVIHCFTGGPGEARRYLDLGGFLSFSGIVTFKGAAEIREAARLVPRDRILVETDSPFLAPEPLRGKRCEPGFVARTLEFLAAERNESAPDLGEATTRNAMQLFFN